jgi:hypothetical protein
MRGKWYWYIACGSQASATIIGASLWRARRTWTWTCTGPRSHPIGDLKTRFTLIPVIFESTPR